ncbi:MAG: hypothetical protein JWP96_281 [Polaromonas sp.]|nr:hypothetical protein [Polaromonas sp.]
MKFLDGFWLGCAVLVLALPAAAIAQSSAVGQATEEALPNHARFDNPVATASLETHRGGTQVFNDMQLAGTTAGNTATDMVTGANAISAGAFANMSGLPVVIQNSGANVLIQNALILNLQMN